MADETARFYFDFVDPLSYLLELELRDLGDDLSIERIGLELRPPPARLTLIDDPALAPRWKRASEIADALGVELTPPKLVPWSRKALELHLHARQYALDGVIRREIFEGHFARGVDIGRVDVLVEIARSAGLDGTETKAVLDVDRFEAQVLAAREAAALAGVVHPPVLVRGAARLEGFHKRATLCTFLATDNGTSRP